LARDMNDLLPTIISRCRHIRFKPISQTKVEERLILEWNVPHSVAQIAAKSSNGNMEKAMMFANIQDGEAQRDEVQCGEEYHQKNDMSHGKTVSEKSGKTITGTDWVSRRQWLLTQLFSLVRPDKNRALGFLSALAIAEKLSRETQLIPDSLVLIKLCLRDMALIKYDKNHLINSDFLDDLSAVADSLPDNYPLTALQAIHEAETRLQSNASVRLVLEHFFLSLICKG
ncbi:MAG: hypothetical protein HQK67_10160, partial [Desulfamplus sp.]|nr:hypothetical protein [Desulfamplus sp.]